jgi:hypothetical protein
MLREARLRMSRTAGKYQSQVALGVEPSRGRFSDHDWDVFTSMCDARAALVLALGRRPHPLTGHALPEMAQLALFEAAS